MTVDAERVPTGEHGAAPRTPGRVFHALLVVATLPLLYAVSVPGVDVFVLFAAVAVLLVCATWWLAWLLAHLARRRWSWSFAVAPVGGLVVLALLTTSAPLHARWALSRGAFDAQVERLSTGVLASGQGRLGLYRVTDVERVPGGVLFSERTGAFLDQAGFAHLPDGPDALVASGHLETPTFRHLGGPWYGWNASW